MKYNKNLDDDKGTTRILTNSEKGYKVIKELKNHTLEEINVEQAVQGFLAMFQSVKYNTKRTIFFKDANTLSNKKLFDKYFPDKLKVKIERNLRKILIKTGFYKKILNIGKKVRKRE